MPTRRTALLSALAATALSAVSARTASAGPRATGPVRLTLPEPGGPHPVGTVALRLVDTARADPWITAQPYRELMISVRYPARDTGGHPRAPQMLPGEAAGFAAVNNLTGVPADQVDWAATRTHAHEEAPADRDRDPYPVVCYSPGTGDPRSPVTCAVCSTWTASACSATRQEASPPSRRCTTTGASRPAPTWTASSRTSRTTTSPATSPPSPPTASTGPSC
ncbi:hypothetical protein AB0D74_37520 [Streptomyces sp. NPDC048278]|uniref:hypothetical protein n=1 Tax=Streptomyces sp. NPDC048278 TaxID=3155809 RepID=UPI003433AF47